MKTMNCTGTGFFGRVATLLAMAVIAVGLPSVCTAQTSTQASRLVWKKPNVRAEESSDVAPEESPDAPADAEARKLPAPVEAAAMPEEPVKLREIQSDVDFRFEESLREATSDVESADEKPTESKGVPPRRIRPNPDATGVDLILSAYEKTKTAKSEVEFSDIIELCEMGLDAEASDQTKHYGRRLVAWAYNRRVEILAKEGREAQALIDFEGAVGYDKTRWRAFHNRGVSHALAGRHSKAIADFSRTIELNPTYANAYFNRGEVKYDLGDVASSVRDYDRAIHLAPDDSAARNSRGHAHYQLGKVKRATADFTEAIRLDPRNSAAYTNRGELFADLGYYQRARKDFQKAIESDPRLGAAHLGMAWLMATCPDSRFRNPKNALIAARLAVELDGEATHQHLDTLAAAYASGGDFESAREVLAQAIDEAPQGASGQYLVRQAMYAQGQPYLSEPRSIPQTAGRPTTGASPRPQPEASVIRKQPRSAPATSTTTGPLPPHTHLGPGSSPHGR